MTVRIGLADADDPRVLDAAALLAGAGEVVPVLFGVGSTPVPAGVEVVPESAGTTPLEQLARTLADGRVVAGVSGSVSTSAEVIRAGIRRLAPRGLVSSCFAMRHPDRWVSYTDCAVVPEPTVEQLVDIAVAAADHHSSMFAEPARVAMLSFSTLGSADHVRVQRVREATQRLQSSRPDLLVAGEMQFDVAVDPDVARRKMPDSPVAGQANVLVFPSLESGNIAYKVAERIGGARALGSFVLGLSHPWVDLSRGCSVADIVETVDLLVGRRGAMKAVR
jgi:phosphate acetyltransferase